ncbi:mediator of RNA polymerase II transcription subunit 15a-like isoform X2 [Lycium barbarum]|uniref:mediator of RNA polymerase II transcription subunit 15a-like isoform X2 n=1 Tax=Lycium barbarum TaxID=112863 RepID=UPI00293EA6B5|nr:mediator of RNA polymerase II transcription subunit 15a-like isoform X2 [Lycium barbarum]
MDRREIEVAREVHSLHTKSPEKAGSARKDDPSLPMAVVTQNNHFKVIDPKSEAVCVRQQNKINLAFINRAEVGSRSLVGTLGRHLPYVDKRLLGFRKIAMRFEQRIFTAATSQSDFLRKISLKMVTVETKLQHPICNETVQVVDESSKFQENLVLT